MAEATRSTRRRLLSCSALFFAWVIVPVLMLAGVEAALRAAGAGRSTQFLFERGTPRGTAYSVNMSFYKQFLYVEADTLGYTPHDVPVPPRTDDTYRVVVLGSSAALGWYFADFSFSRYLEAMLRAAYPERDVEVISLAWFGMNSHVMRVVAEHFPQLQPDLVVVYTGNNEMTGPFGLLSRLGSRELSEAALDRAIRRHVWLSNLRLLQLLGEGAQNLSYSAVGGMRWGFDAPVTTLDDPRLLRVYGHYEQNLHRICDEAAKQGVPVLLGTILRNERDWQPRNSLENPAWTDADEAARNELLRAAAEARAAGDLPGARAHLEAAVAMDPRHAETQYNLARCLLDMGELEAAREAFHLAYTLDSTLDFATPPINEAVRRVAAARADGGVLLVDAALDLAAISPDGMVGRELMYDHIHLTREGNYHLARQFAQRVADLPADARPAAEMARDWLSMDECNAWVGASNEGLRIELEHAHRSVYEMWPEQDIAWLLEQAEALKGGGEPALPATRLEGWRTAVELNPEDFLARYRFIENGLRVPESRREVAQHADLLAERHPDYWRSRFAQLEAYNYLGNPPEALETARDLVASFPFFPESHYHLARAMVRTGETEEALQILRWLGKRYPTSDLPANLAANLLRREGRHQEVIQTAQRAISVNPYGEGPYATIDSSLVALEDPEARIRFWQRLAGRYSEPGHAHYRLSLALGDAGRDADAAVARTQAAAANPGRYGNLVP